MLSEASSRLCVPLVFLDPSPSSPAKQINAVSLTDPSLAHIDGSFADPAQIELLASKVDVITVEIEHVDAKMLARVRDTCKGRSGKGVEVYPSPETITVIQDKFAQKEHLASHGIPVADFVAVEYGGGDGAAAVRRVSEKLGVPLMLKSRTLAYDGRGNFLLRDLDQSPKALEALGGGSHVPIPQRRPLYAERFAPFVCEIAVMVVRGTDGTVRSYPAVETVHKDNICHIVRAPLRRGGREVLRRAMELAERAVDTFGPGAVGVFGVEMFLMPDGEATSINPI
jgi:phosphoribosylaminoimidazole carboxylase